jgi:hypothetical protein
VMCSSLVGGAMAKAPGHHPFKRLVRISKHAKRPQTSI